MVLKAAYAAGLLVVGFVGGIIGVFAYTKTPLSSLVSSQPLLADTRSSTDLCSDTQNEEDEEVYFLGCGGIF